MSINLIRDLKTIRTNPRLMEDDRGNIVMTLHDHENGIYIHLNGPFMGKIAKTTDTNFDGLRDLKGSVTLYNCD
jgi:hypothetical protein